MPLKGRSARAGALRKVADFFSGNGSGALSSLAATAGGGVTAISMGRTSRIGRSLEKQHLAPNNKARKRDSDMHGAGATLLSPARGCRRRVAILR
jgi:hypothetical protein